MSTGFLVTYLTGKLKSVSDLVNQQLLKKLYIYVAVKQNQQNFKNNDWVSKKIIDMYSSSSCLFPNLDVRIILNELKLKDERMLKVKDFDADVIILPKSFEGKKICPGLSSKKKLFVLYSDTESEIEAENNTNSVLKTYQNVVLGGTFDRLHNGHKILLSEALLRCSKKLIVGVTDENLIKGKVLWELMEPSTKRIRNVETFVKEVDESVECQVVLISDMYGPTKFDPNLNMLVVSTETFKGGLKVNELRKSNHLSELDMHVVDLVEEFETSAIEEKKISSSTGRMRLLGAHLKNPKPKPDLPSRPYLVGLTGGLASGKSSICEYLKTLGAGVIDCDKVAHELYKPKTDLYFKLIELFGENILSENGDVDRKQLGALVFNDLEKLQNLNDLMWPAIYKAAIAEANRLYNEENKDIVVLEAAALVKANWKKKVHEVWSAIIPQEEAINRVIKRNNFTREEAQLRINAQPSNSELVAISNVVFCSLWSYEFTRKQVDKAWESVNKFINK